jgi:hypothetical protein
LKNQQKKKKVICVLVLMGLFFHNPVYSQDFSGEMNEMMSSSKKNFGKFNVLAGVNSMNLTFDDGNGRTMKTSFPNVYGYYIGGNTFSLISETETSFLATTTDFIFGKQSITAPSSNELIEDSLSLYNFSKYKGYLFKAPFKLLYNRKVGNNFYWGVSVGAVLEAPLLMGRITNGSQTEDLSAVSNQYLSGFGWTTGLEIGFRSAFVTLEYMKGISNMSKADDGTEIRNDGSLSLSVGIRFNTKQGKKDAKAINSLKDKFTN